MTGAAVMPPVSVNLCFNGGGCTVEISGGTVTATGGDYAAGIGGGNNGGGCAVEISGGTVTATGSYYGAGIGGGQYETVAQSKSPAAQ